MKYFKFLALFFVSFSLSAANFNIIKDQSTISWNGKKVGGEHYGKISLKEGNLTMEGNDLKGGQFIIDMTSITCEDINNEEYNAKLVNHLKSADFFDVSKHPEAKLFIKDVQLGKGGHLDITADLTINGQTKPIDFKAEKSKAGDTIVFSTKLTLDRTLWGIKYKSKSFFKDLTDNFIHDEFTVDVKLVAAQ